MSNEILLHTSGTVVCWADSNQYVAGTYGMVFPRTHTINLKGTATNKARQSQRADLGEKRAQGYVVKAAVEFATAPTAGGPIEYYWSSSSSSHPASGNVGGGQMIAGTYIPFVSGIDGTFIGPTDDETHLDQWKQFFQFVGVISAAAEAVGFVQSKVINSYFTPAERYGQFVVKNDSDQSFCAGGSGMYIAMCPIVDEIQQ